MRSRTMGDACRMRRIPCQGANRLCYSRWGHEARPCSSTPGHEDPVGILEAFLYSRGPAFSVPLIQHLRDYSWQDFKTDRENMKKYIRIHFVQAVPSSDSFGFVVMGKKRGGGHDRSRRSASHQT